MTLLFDTPASSQSAIADIFDLLKILGTLCYVVASLVFVMAIYNIILSMKDDDANKQHRAYIFFGIAIALIIAGIIL